MTRTLLLAHYRDGGILRYVDTDTIEASAGEVMINGYMRKNTSAVDVEFDPDVSGTGPNLGLDTGSAQPDTTYYIYAVADDAETTFDLIISTSSSAPTGPTYYRKLGWFETNSTTSPVEIRTGSIGNVFEDSNGLQIASGSYVGTNPYTQYIEVGFQPYAIWIIDTTNNSGSFVVDNWTISPYYEFSTNGFTAKTYGNYQGYTFNWIAWGY